jgi:hypothetical protein
MNIHCRYECPAKLQENQSYFMKVSDEKDSIPIFTQVKFIRFTTCPAVVVVQDGRYGSFPRENLFIVVKYIR